MAENSENPTPTMSKEKKKRIFQLKLGISLCLLLFVLWKTEIGNTEGRRELLLTLRNADERYVLLSLVTGLLPIIVSAWRWQILLRSKGIQMKITRLFSLYLVGRFFNLFLPGSIGGDAARIWGLSQNSGEKREGLASIVVERASGMIVLILFASLALLLGLHQYPLRIFIVALAFLTALTLISFWLILNRDFLALLSRWLGHRFSLAEILFTELQHIQDAIRAYKDTPAALFQAFVLSALFYCTAIVNVWVSTCVFLPDASLFSMLLIVPALMLIMNLPVSIGGAGLLEAGFAILFPLFGYPLAVALSTALLVRCKFLVYGMTGGLLHLNRIKEKG
ncbi:hypothetical protein KKHLCK_13455 [Candidatus Electrothrix laxa]